MIPSLPYSLYACVLIGKSGGPLSVETVDENGDAVQIDDDLEEEDYYFDDDNDIDE
jgi:hypothetical protein